MEKTQKIDIKKVVALKEFPATIALLILFLILSIATPNFLGITNLMNMARQAAIISIVAMGEAFILISGEVDLSVGAMLGFCGIMAANLWSAGMPPLAVLFGTLCTGAAVAAISGLLITRLNLAAFAVTLGMLSILKGAMLVITNGFQLKYESPLAVLGHGYLGEVPYAVVVMAVIFGILFILLKKTPFGRQIFSTGSNATAAQISGINTKNIKLMCYVIVGILCGCGSLLMVGSVLSAGATTGIGYENDIIAACVIGGTTLRGGEGSIAGVVIGSFLLGILRNGFVLLDIGASWQLVATGTIIVLAIILDCIKNRKKNY